VINLATVRRLLGLRWADVTNALLRPVAGVGVMAAALVVLREPLWNGGRPVLAGALVLVALIAAGAVVYLAAVLLAWRAFGRPNDSAEQAVLATLAGAWRRRKAA
jgi:hypothetical protein